MEVTSLENDNPETTNMEVDSSAPTGVDPLGKDASAASTVAETGDQSSGDHQSVKIKYEDYKRIMNVLIHRLRKLEEDAESAVAAANEESLAPRDAEMEDTEGVESETGSDPSQKAKEDDFSDIGGSKKSDLVKWYLESIEDEIESMEELALWKIKVEKIINRLIDHEHAVIAISRADDESDPSRIEDPLLVVHPNYLVEE